MTILVAEDEALAAQHLVEMIQQHDASINVAAQLDSVKDVIQFLRSGKGVDLMFLDIQLADGKSFEIFDSISTDVPIIFTTAYDQYALKAFKHHSIDYLLKPIQSADLNAAIDKFKRLRNKSSLNNESIQVLRDLIEHKPLQYKQRIIVKSGSKIMFKLVEEVCYFFAEGKEAYMVTQKENRKYLVTYTLEELEELLDPNDFFRISRKYIVRANSIVEVKGSITTQVEVRLAQPTGQVITVSREKVNSFKKWLDH